ncbi:MAG: peptide ABC transporter substrate-binding protein [Spirochaetia bacterium]|nr:peptide ABC transporter substrate-binding protein [Spirochaetia bacterium]
MKKLLTVLLCLFLAMGVFISCSGKEEAAPAAEKVVETPKAETPAPKAEAAKPAEPAAPAPAPVADEPAVFKLINGAEPESLDPHLIQGVPEHRIYESLFEGLFAYDPVTADAIPGLAESYEVSDDGLVYTFTLRDAVWSDGVAITAQTVVDSWLRELNPETAAPYAWFPSMFVAGAAEYNGSDNPDPSVVQIRALDEKTFQMELIGPLPYVLGALPHYSFAVVPLHAIEEHGAEWTSPENFVGNGPFVLNEWKPQQYISVVPNDKYWDAEAVQLDEVVYYAIDDNNTAYNMYLNGEVDWMTTVPSDQLEAAKMRDDYYASPQLATYYYVFQVERAPFDDVNVRKAFALSVDRDALVEQITRAGQIPAWGIVPPMTGYDGLGEPMMDVRKAQELLADAGYPGGEGFPETVILYNTSEGHKKIAEFLQQEWENNLDVEVKLENQEWGTYLSNRNKGDFQVARAGWVGDYQDPNTFLDMFITGGGMNGGRYSNDDYDRLINDAARMTPGPERFAALMEAESIMINEDQANMPLYYYVTLNMIDTDKWGGWHTNTMDYHPTKDIYLK